MAIQQLKEVSFTSWLFMGKIPKILLYSTNRKAQMENQIQRITEHLNLKHDFQQPQSQIFSQSSLLQYFFSFQVN